MSKPPRAAKGLSALGGLVYSTESGRMCPDCRQPLASCQCKALARAAARPVGDGVVRVWRETKGRGGKAVTLVRGLPLTDAEIDALAKQLKTACGSGGTVKDGVVEIQGDHVARLVEWLAARSFKVKRAGG